jgi:hypothetical protein
LLPARLRGQNNKMLGMSRYNKNAWNNPGNEVRDKQVAYYH